MEICKAYGHNWDWNPAVPVVRCGNCGCVRTAAGSFVQYSYPEPTIEEIEEMEIQQLRRELEEAQRGTADG